MDTPAQGGQVPLKIPPEDVDLLRGWFTACAEGRRADAEKEPDSDANPRRLEEAEAFDQLRAALSTYSLRPTRAIREALCGLATGIDATNDYATAVREHNAAHGLLDQLSMPPFNPLAHHFSENLRKLRKEAGISQEELGFRSALHRTQIGVLERGTRVPRIDTLIKLASAFDVEMKCPLTEGIEWDRRYMNGGAFVYLNEMDRRLEQLRAEAYLPPKEEPDEQ